MSRGFRKSAASGVMASQPTNAQNNCRAARPTVVAPYGANGRNADRSTWPSVRPTISIIPAAIAPTERSCAHAYPQARSIEHVGESNEATSEHEPCLPSAADKARGVLAGDQGGDHIPGRRLRQEDPAGRRPSPWAEGTLDRSGEAGRVRPVTR